MFTEIKQAAREAGHKLTEGNILQVQDLQTTRDFLYFSGGKKLHDVIFSSSQVTPVSSDIVGVLEEVLDSKPASEEVPSTTETTKIAGQDQISETPDNTQVPVETDVEVPSPATEVIDQDAETPAEQEEEPTEDQNQGDEGTDSEEDDLEEDV